MAKPKPNLAGALAKTKEEPAAPVQAAPAQPRKAPTRAANEGRAGLKNISAYFSPAVKYGLDELCLKRSRELGRKVTQQEIMAESFNDIFKKYGMAEVAPSNGD